MGHLPSVKDWKDTKNIANILCSWGSAEGSTKKTQHQILFYQELHNKTAQNSIHNYRNA
jgi:hypothetical protein